MSINASFLVDFLSARSTHWRQWGAKITHSDCIHLNLSIYVLQDVLYIFRHSYVACTNVYKIYILLLDSSLHHYSVSFFFSYYRFCFKVYFVWYMYCYPIFIFSFPFLWNTFLHPFTFSLGMSLVLSWVSCTQHMYGSFFLSIQIPCFFWLEHLSHLHLKWLLIDMYLLPIYFYNYVSSFFFLLLKEHPLPWLSGSFGWNIIPFIKRWWVLFLVRAHT